MRFKKLSFKQKKIRAYKLRRNHVICELMAADPFLTASAAMKKALEIMRARRR